MHPRLADFGIQRLTEYINKELSFVLPQLAQCNSCPIKLRKILLLATANIFYQFLCSKRFPVDDPNFVNVVETYDEVFHELFQGFDIDFMPWLRFFNRGKLKRLRELAAKVGNVTADIFEERACSTNKRTDCIKDLVDIFLEQCSVSDPVLSLEESEVIVEDLIGGHSVLSNLWLWGLQFLAMYPHAANKIRQESLTLTGGCRSVTLSDRAQLPYTEATVLELLRVIASPIIPHVATKNTSIQGYSVVKDSMIMFNTYDMNMDPRMWKDPESFNPDRFLNGQKIQKPDYFFPFGMGKRTCMGDGLVRSVLLMAFSTILQNFDISLPDDVKPMDVKSVCGMVFPEKEIQLCFRRLNEKGI